jgi:hypothetical protein
MSRCATRLSRGILTLTLFSGACAQPSSPTSTTPLPLTRFRGDSSAFLIFSGLDEPATRVLRNRDEWQSIWNQMYRRQNPIPALPDVDFSREMVVLTALGIRPSSGYDIQLTEASETDGLVTVRALARSPGSNCVTLTVITSPLDLARLPKRSGTVVFQTTSEVTNCQ